MKRINFCSTRNHYIGNLNWYFFSKGTVVYLPMAAPKRVMASDLVQFIQELTNWEPRPYPLICLAKHELVCKLGMAFYVDIWPCCNAVVAIATSCCKNLNSHETVLVDARNYEKLFVLLQQAPIDWNKQFYFALLYKNVFEVCEKVGNTFGIAEGTDPGYTMLQKAPNDIPDVRYQMGTQWVNSRLRTSLL